MNGDTRLDFCDKVVVITGAGSGIGKALAVTFAQQGAIVVAVDLKNSQATIKSLGNDTNRTSIPRHLAFDCDVTRPSEMQAMIRRVKQRFGTIDIYCSNAGIMYPPSARNDSAARLTDKQWNKVLQVNLQSHVIAARELLPDWEAGLGMGIFVLTASAAGLLTQIGDACYGVSKAAAVSFAEHLAIAHPKVQVHCVCPQAVKTPFLGQLGQTSRNSATLDGLISAEQVADCTLEAIRNKEFWVFPHERVPEYHRRKVLDHPRWLRGMQKLRDRLRQPHDPRSKL